MSSIAATIEQGRRAILAHERAMTVSLLEAYQMSWGRIERELITIERQIAAMAADGGAVHPEWLGRQRWWLQVQEGIEREMAVFSDTALMTLAQGQAGAVTLATNVASGVASTVGFPGVVHSGAMEHWVSALQPGSPLRPVLNRYGSEVSGTIRKRITEGLGSGRGSRNIVRDLVRELGKEVPEYKLKLITRTETHRAYRGAFQDQMTPLEQRNVVTGYVWLAALDPRTCIACLGMHGQRIDEYPTDQHPCCRCVVRPLVNQALLKHASTYRGRTGEEWLREQPEKIQEQVLQTPGRYRMWKEGMPLSEMITHRHDTVWGDTIAVKPMYQIVHERKRDAA